MKKNDINGLLRDSFDKMCDEYIEMRNELAIKMYLLKAVNDDMPLKEVVQKYYIHEEPDTSLRDTPTSYKNIDGKILINRQDSMTYGTRMVLMERDIPYMDTRGYEDFKADVINFLMKGIEI